MTPTVVREPLLRLSSVVNGGGTEWDCTLCGAGRVRLHFDDALTEWAEHYRTEHGEPHEHGDRCCAEHGYHAPVMHKGCILR